MQILNQGQRTLYASIVIRPGSVVDLDDEEAKKLKGMYGQEIRIIESEKKTTTKKDAG